MYVKIDKNRNGSHAFQIGGPMETGWAVVPEGMQLPSTFPFVDIEVDVVTSPSTNGTGAITRLEVVSMTEGVEIPVEEPEVVPEKSVWEQLDEAYQKGVDSV